MYCHHRNASAWLGLKCAAASCAILLSLVANAQSVGPIASKAEPCATVNAGIPGVTLELLSDIYPGGDATPAGFLQRGSKIYFAATDADHGRELWETDDAVVQLKKDLYPGTTGSSISGLAAAGSKVCFLANDASTGAEFWKLGNVQFSASNPQPILIEDLTSGSFLSHRYLEGGNSVYVVAEPSAWPSPGTQLYRSDGTAEGTLGLGGISGVPHGGGTAKVTALGSQLDLLRVYSYLSVAPYDRTETLYVVDDSGKTVLLRVSYASGETPLGISSPATVGGTGYFAADPDGAGYRIWSTDGTPEGTALHEPGAELVFVYAGAAFAFDGRVWFGGRETGGADGLWSYDPATGSAAYMAAIEPDWSNALVSGGYLYFAGDDGTTGSELYLSDGTPEGTRIAGDINPGDADAEPGKPAALDGMLYFAADHCAYGRELWGLALPDGAPALIADLNPGPEDGVCGSGEIEPTALLFAGSTPDTGCELWQIVHVEVPVEGAAEGEAEGVVEGEGESAADGEVEGSVDGDGEGGADGEGAGSSEGEGEGGDEGEGATEGEEGEISVDGEEVVYDPCQNLYIEDASFESANLSTHWSDQSTGPLQEMLALRGESAVEPLEGFYALRFIARETDDVHAIGQTVTLDAGSYELTLQARRENAEVSGSISVALGETAFFPSAAAFGGVTEYQQEAFSFEIESAGDYLLVLANPALSGGDVYIDNVCIHPALPGDGEGEVDGEGEGESACPAGGPVDPALVGTWQQDCQYDEFYGMQVAWTFRDDGTFTRNSVERGDEWEEFVQTGTYAVNTSVTPHQIDIHYCEFCFEDVFDDFDCPDDWCCSVNLRTGLGIYSLEEGLLNFRTGVARPNSFLAGDRFSASSDSYCPASEIEGEIDCETGGVIDPDLVGEWRHGCDFGSGNAYERVLTFREDGTYSRYSLEAGMDSGIEARGTYAVNTFVYPNRIELKTCELCTDGLVIEGEESNATCLPEESDIDEGIYYFYANSLRLVTETETGGELPEEITNEYQYSRAPGTFCPVEIPEGEIEAEAGEGEGEGGPSLQMLSADWDGVEGVISLTELLRVIQFYNANGFACADVEDDTEDGFVPGPGGTDCPRHTSDYLDSDWSISLSELLRLIQIFNAGGYEYCPEAGTDDDFCPVAR